MTLPAADFWRIAAREGFVTDEVATQSTAASVDSPHSDPGKWAVSSGRLSAAEAEIVECLAHPCDLVPGYELLSHLGHGGMGAVYRARQLAFDRVVALKTVLVGERANSSTIARFEQEALSLGRLVHPHLVTAYDFGKHGGRLFLAMEFIDGENAEQMVEREGQLSERHVWGIIRQAASGLAYAASAGVIHRDVKPANLLLTIPPEGFPLEAGLPLVKVADFGLALLESGDDSRTRLTGENMAVGSPHFMAPEQLEGRNVDQRADIYGLGSTAYHLLAGKPPFDGLSMMQIFSRKLTSDPPPLETLRPDLTPETLSLVRDMLERDPKERVADYRTVLDRIDKVRQAMAGVGGTGLDGYAGSSADTQATLVAVPATRRSWIRSVSMPSQTRRGWFAILFGLVGMVLAMIGGGIDWASSRRSLAPGARSWRPTGWGVSCFDGRSLNGWRVLGGNWIPGVDDGEGGRLLAGTNGMLVYPLVKVLGNERRVLAGYQVLMLASVREAAAVELQFAFTKSDGDGETDRRAVLRLLPGSAQLGYRSQSHGALDTVLAERRFEGDADPLLFHELRLERQSSDWYVLVDDHLLGNVPIPSTPVLPEFRLATELRPGQTLGAGWFGDIVLEEIAPVGRSEKARSGGKPPA